MRRFGLLPLRSICLSWHVATRNSIQPTVSLPWLISTGNFSSRSGSRRRVPVKKSSANKAVVPVEEAWTEVRDETSGLSYWWNKQTNETTHLGAPRPTGPTSMTVPPPSSAPLPLQRTGGGLGSVLAEGMAFGVGSAIAHRAVGSLFGSFGGGEGGDDDSGSGDDFIDV